jgi:hypothetical protein
MSPVNRLLPVRTRSRSRNTKLVVFVVLCAVFVVFQSRTHSQSPVITPKTNINQSDLGKTPQVNPTIAQVLESGGQFWTTPFLIYDPATGTGDGYGEGQFGPRSDQRKVFNPAGFPQGYRFLRMNGLDSQSCYECHNSIGSDPGYGVNSPLIRKPGSVGGSAGSNSNAFINPMFPGTPDQPNGFLTLFIRQPPHVFGTGYTVTLAGEMTRDLMNLKTLLRQKAILNPGKPQSTPLTSKGLDFGVFTTTYTGPTTPAVVNGNDLNTCPPVAGATPVPPENFGGMPGFKDDVSRVTGVSGDLIVRPLQWKGVASSVRHFVRDALNFHMSMQAAELVGDCDCDLDGKPGAKNKSPEMTIGNVTAMTAFVGMTRPPQQVVPSDPATKASVALGYQIFTGNSSTASASLKSRLYQNMCANCHVPSMPLNDPTFRIDTPLAAEVSGCPKPNGPFPPALQTGCPDPSDYATSRGALVTPLKSADNHPEIRKHKQRLGVDEDVKLRNVPVAAITNTSASKLDAAASPAPFSITLSPAASAGFPAYVYPRLPLPFFPALAAPPNNALGVPLFSDLRRHNMGTFLADRMGFRQGADIGGICIAEPLFVTRPLWGVADTGPWLHDGRALTLMDAILMHGDTACQSGSDAASVIDAFQKLSPAEKQAVVDFLLTLRLPLEQGLVAANP